MRNPHPFPFPTHTCPLRVVLGLPSPAHPHDSLPCMSDHEQPSLPSPPAAEAEGDAALVVAERFLNAIAQGDTDAFLESISYYWSGPSKDGPFNRSEWVVGRDWASKYAVSFTCRDPRLEEHVYSPEVERYMIWEPKVST